jgi:hypothetical protein
VLQRPARSVIAMEPKQQSVRLASIFKIRELNVLLALLIVGALISLATPIFSPSTISWAYSAHFR